ncbi:MAG: hypothetical protein ACPGF7_13625 [Pontibacterium sp.]
MKIIGLTGFAGVGKDTVGQIILDNKTGYARAIADPLKRAVLCVFGDGDVFEAARELFALTDHQLRDVNGMAVEVPFWGDAGGTMIDRLGACLLAEFGDDLWWRIADVTWPNLTANMLSDRALKEVVLPEWDLSPRQIMQRFGDAIRGEFGADVLLKRAQLDLGALRVMDSEEGMPSDVVVYTDIRADYEAEWVRERGGVVVQVIRKGVAPVAEHSTERAVSRLLLDGALHNEGDLNNLRYHVGYNLGDWFRDAVDIENAERKPGTWKVSKDHWICRVARAMRIADKSITDQQALAAAREGVAEMFDGFYHEPEAAAEILGNRWIEAQLESLVVDGAPGELGEVA